MHRLQRLTGSVLVRASVGRVQPQPSLAYAVRCVGSLSDKAESYGQESLTRVGATPNLRPMFSHEDRDYWTHPFADAADDHPGVLRPDGSNSEEVVAGDRFDMDPLADVKLRRAPRANTIRPEMRQHVKTEAPGLTEVEDDEDLVRGGPAAGP